MLSINHNTKTIVHMEARLENIDISLHSDILQKQLSAWNQQSVVLRSAVQELWSEEAHKWWNSIKEEIRTALILTAIEDLPKNTAFAPLIYLVCPEFSDVEALFAEDGKKVIDIIKMVVNEKENDQSNFDFRQLQQSISGNSESSSKEDTLFGSIASQATEHLKISRSCILLQFATAILLIYENETSENQ